MKVSESELKIIETTAKRLGIGSVYLFGSILDDGAEPEDIDIAVRGVPPGHFFKFYGALLRELSRPVDIVDLSRENAVTKIIASEAVKIYG